GGRLMRLSFCYPPPERITEGVRRRAGVLDRELELQRTFGNVTPRMMSGSQFPSPDTA
ncbi:MAG: PLP-dependent aminotransferase family protein, partial [Pseudonocardiaceae bacterium]